MCKEILITDMDMCQKKGTFNDRLRDAVRGGSAFGPVRAQGFATGLLTEPNQVPNDEDEDDEGCSSNNNSEEENEKKMKYYCEIISLGMAGNLGSFPLMVNDSGKQVKGLVLRSSDSDYRCW